MRALDRVDCAARSFADLDTPRNVGMAMARRMAMINSTTISSMRVKPDSPHSFVRCWRAWSNDRVSMSPTFDPWRSGLEMWSAKKMTNQLGFPWECPEIGAKLTRRACPGHRQAATMWLGGPVPPRRHRDGGRRTGTTLVQEVGSLRPPI